MFDPRDQTVHIFVSPTGEMTTDRPHVHVIHDEIKNEVRVVATTAAGQHPVKEPLPGNVSGNQVNAVVEDLAAFLRDHSS